MLRYRGGEELLHPRGLRKYNRFARKEDALNAANFLIKDRKISGSDIVILKTTKLVEVDSLTLT